MKSHFPLKRTLTASQSPGKRQKPKSLKQSWVFLLPEMVCHFLEKGYCEKNIVSPPPEQATTWYKRTQALCFLFEIMSSRLSIDLWWWCFNFFFFSCMLIIQVCECNHGRISVPHPSWNRAPVTSPIELIQLLARYQDLHPGRKISFLSPGTLLCWHWLQTLRNELALHIHAGFYGNGYQGLGQGHQT